MERTPSFHGSLLATIAAITIGFGTPAAAQTTDAASRAQALANARDQKAESLSIPQRSPVERALQWYDMHGARAQWRGFHFSGGNFPGGAGMGYGVGLTAKGIGTPVADPEGPNRLDADLFAARSARGYQRFAARLDVRNVAGAPIDLSLRGQDYQLTQEDFYGLGADSDAANRSNYRHDGSDFGIGMSWRLSRSWRVGGEVSYLTPTISDGTDSRYPTTQSQYDEDQLPGLNGLPAFFRVDGSAAFDWRDNESHPRRGGEYRATLSQYRGVDDSGYDFRRLDIEAQQIIPLFSRYRRIELRGGASLTEAADGAAVPFIYLPSLGGVTTLRGFSGARFRDQNAVWGRAEYQWEAWWAMDAALFIDAGQVAAGRSDFNLNEFEVTYGIGFRIHSNRKFIARLDLAYGREGFMPILGFKYGF